MLDQVLVRRNEPVARCQRILIIYGDVPFWSKDVWPCHEVEEVGIGTLAS